MLIMNILLGIKDPDRKLQIQGNLVSTMKFAPIFMKFGIQETSDMLIILLYVEWKTQRKKFWKNWFQT